VSHPAQTLRTGLGGHPETAEVSLLVDDASRICGAAVVEMGAPGPACASCGFNPEAAFGETACPFSTLYWDFLLRHGLAMEGDPRIAAQLRALGSLTPGDRAMLRQRAMAIRINNGRRPGATDVRPVA
jgi:deoxyribodipyrimidine photolyase-related protein